jgi:uncharacterized protein YceH (UPF0502 family)
MAWFSDIFGAIRKLDGLMRVEQTHGAMIKELGERQRRSEAREEILIAKAEAAAATAASVAASQHVSDLSRRLGNLEARVAHLEQAGTHPPRLPPPE